MASCRSLTQYISEILAASPVCKHTMSEVTRQDHIT